MLSRYVYANKEFWGRDKAYAKLGTWNVFVCVCVLVWRVGGGLRNECALVKRLT